jgi:hypothetical protein
VRDYLLHFLPAHRFERNGGICTTLLYYYYGTVNITRSFRQQSPENDADEVNQEHRDWLEAVFGCAVQPFKKSTPSTRKKGDLSLSTTPFSTGSSLASLLI